MSDSANSYDLDKADLKELNYYINELEILERKRVRENIPFDLIVSECQRLIEGHYGNIGIIQERIVKQANSNMSKLLGHSPDELTENTFARYVHYDELPKLAQIYQQRISGEDVPSIYHTVLKHKNGQDLRVRIIAGIFARLGKPATLAILKDLRDHEQGSRGPTA